MNVRAVKGLLAIDVDGTLLRHDGSIAADDRRALRKAQAAGIVVTLASGRLPSGLLPVARDLRLRWPIIAVDGAVILSVRSGRPVRTMTFAGAGRFARAWKSAGLPVFATTAKGIAAHAADHNHCSFVGTWAPAQIVTDHDFPNALNVFALGAADAVAKAAELAAAESGEHVVSSPLYGTGLSLLKAAPTTVSKATGVHALARRLGLSHERVACIGDHHNDIAMFKACGTSFVMAGAPDAVVDSASVRLRARTGEGGGVAEAVRHWL